MWHSLGEGLKGAKAIMRPNYSVLNQPIHWMGVEFSQSSGNVVGFEVGQV